MFAMETLKNQSATSSNAQTAIFFDLRELLVLAIRFFNMTTYSPIAYVYREIISEEIASARSGKVFYFNEENSIDSTEGRVLEVIEKDGAQFIRLEPEKEIRIDRIITLFGKPGAAYDEYDNFANQCLSCTGGYDL
jgi:hypothetical protein